MNGAGARGQHFVLQAGGGGGHQGFFLVAGEELGPLAHVLFRQLPVVTAGVEVVGGAGDKKGYQNEFHRVFLFLEIRVQ